jgi:hypothetical protein
MTLKPGESTSMARQNLDAVTLYLSDGQIRLADGTGPTKIIARKQSDVDFEVAGSRKKEQVLSHDPMRVVEVNLKNHASPHYTGNKDFPLAFPRPGSKKIFENDRIIVWSYTWKQGAKIPTHYHDKDAVVAYLGDGSLNSMPVNGKSQETHHATGEVRFNKGDRSHYEVLDTGRLSAVIVELK